LLCTSHTLPYLLKVCFAVVVSMALPKTRSVHMATLPTMLTAAWCQATRKDFCRSLELKFKAIQLAGTDRPLQCWNHQVCRCIQLQRVTATGVAVV
jgi:hypothetical protein